MLETDDRSPDFYRLVLEHGDFGIHNISITKEENMKITSLYDWETGCIVPALLSDPTMSLYADMVVDEHANPTLARVSKNASEDEIQQLQRSSILYIAVSNNLALKRTM